MKDNILCFMVSLNIILIFSGPRGNGKSTNINRVRKQLQDQYCCLFTTFQQGMSFESKKEFWTSFGEQIQRRNPHVDVPRIEYAKDFDKFLDGSNKEKLFGNKQVVMFVDEFDLLYYAKDESVIDDVLNVLRGIKQTKETSSLHSFVGIGPFSILELTGKSASPFNIRHALRSPNFEEKDVVELFAQVRKTTERSLMIEFQLIFLNELLDIED
jgi:hypothetical protein